jgi:amidase
MEDYEFIVAPIVGAPPFRLDEPLPSTVGGKSVERFQDVFLSTYVFSVTGLPMVAVPCGLTGDGRPVGMQIVGRRLRDDSVLEAAAAYQAVAAELFRRPEINLAAIKPVSDAMRTPGVTIDKG